MHVHIMHVYIIYILYTDSGIIDIKRTKVQVWKKTYHANINQNKAGKTILMPDKGDFKTKTSSGKKGAIS